MIINQADLLKHAKSAVIAGAALAITLLSQYALGLDYGPYTPYVVAGLTFLVNALQMAAKQATAGSA